MFNGRRQESPQSCRSLESAALGASRHPGLLFWRCSERTWPPTTSAPRWSTTSHRPSLRSTTLSVTTWRTCGLPTSRWRWTSGTSTGTTLCWHRWWLISQLLRQNSALLWRTLLTPLEWSTISSTLSGHRRWDWLIDWLNPATFMLLLSCAMGWLDYWLLWILVGRVTWWTGALRKRWSNASKQCLWKLYK